MAVGLHIHFGEVSLGLCKQRWRRPLVFLAGNPLALTTSVVSDPLHCLWYPQESFDKIMCELVVIADCRSSCPALIKSGSATKASNIKPDDLRWLGFSDIWWESATPNNDSYERHSTCALPQAKRSPGTDVNEGSLARWSRPPKIVIRRWQPSVISILPVQRDIILLSLCTLSRITFGWSLWM